MLSEFWSSHLVETENEMFSHKTIYWQACTYYQYTVTSKKKFKGKMSNCDIYWHIKYAGQSVNAIFLEETGDKKEVNLVSERYNTENGHF